MRLTKLQQYKRNYYIQNKDKLKQQHKKWVDNNKDKARQHQKKYREANKDKYKQNYKDYYIKNKCKVKQRNKDYYIKNKCKVKQRNKDYYKNNKDKHKQYHLNKTYGISLEQYNQMFTNQSGNCAICGRNQSELKARLCVDHDHETGDIRALLCDSCNSMIGFAKDNAENLINGAEYLNNHNRI